MRGIHVISSDMLSHCYIGGYVPILRKHEQLVMGSNESLPSCVATFREADVNFARATCGRRRHEEVVPAETSRA